jgi:alanyl-tRNA synthetase
MIGSLRIIGESSIAAGVRRIEAVTAEGADSMVDKQQDLFKELRSMMNNMPNIAQAIRKSIEENAEMKKQIENYIREKALATKKEIVEKATEVKGVKLYKFIGAAQPEAMKDVAFQLKGETKGSFAFVAGIVNEEKCSIMVMLSDDLVKNGLNAGKLVKEAAKFIQGGGGGQPHFATAGGKDASGMAIAVNEIIKNIGLD